MNAVHPVTALTGHWLSAASVLLLKSGEGEATLRRWVLLVEAMLRDQLAGRPCRMPPEYGWHADAGGWIHYRALLSVDEAVALNFAIADALARDADVALSVLPSIMVLPYADHAD